MKTKNADITILNENRKALHDFQVLGKTEVGIQLYGAEVKSARLKHVNLAGSYAEVLDGELWLVGASIARYSNSNWMASLRDFMTSLSRIMESCKDECRSRKLLCHKKELKDFKYKTEAKGFTLVPLKMYIKDGRIKVELALAKGKNTVDKRQTIKNRDIDRDIKRI